MEIIAKNGMYDPAYTLKRSRTGYVDRFIRGRSHYSRNDPILDVNVPYGWVKLSIIFHFQACGVKKITQVARLRRKI